MSAHEYRDDDAGYFRWLDTHPDGQVLNIAASLNPVDAKVHQAGCPFIRPQAGRSATGSYRKVCATQFADLEQWAAEHGIALPTPCKTCHRAATPPAGAAVLAGRRHARAPLLDGRGIADGPRSEARTVQAWAMGYVRYGAARPPWQEDLRADLRARLLRLRPSAGQLLHARFVGDKPGDSDVENLLLFNIEAFKAAGANGIRFEQATTVPAAPDGADYPYHYSYELAPESGSFGQWRVVRELASFDWADLGAFTGERKVVQVWLAIKRGHPAVAAIPIAANTPFAVTVTIRPPRSKREPRADLLMKSVFDGVIAAFQSHTDIAVLDDVAARLVTAVPADPVEIARHLGDTASAVLGSVDQLVRPQRSAGTWNPGDHWCLAGELRLDQPQDDSWAIRGTVVEIARHTSRPAGAGEVSPP